MSKIDRISLNLDSLHKQLDPTHGEKHNWKLIREHDGLTKTSVEVAWIEFDEFGSFKSKEETILEGRTLLMSPFNMFFTWQTTPVTEIIINEPDCIKFKTNNSIYILTKI